MEYYPTIKKNLVLTHAITWMNLNEVKRAKGKKLHTVWFNLYDIRKTIKLQGQKWDEQLLGVILRDTIFGEMMDIFYNLIVVVTHL